jgi:hypothetical protein
MRICGKVFATRCFFQKDNKDWVLIITYEKGAVFKDGWMGFWDYEDGKKEV